MNAAAPEPPTPAAALRDPPRLRPQDVEALPTWRAAYADRTCALMATFCQYAYMPFEINGPPPDRRQPRAVLRGGKAQLRNRLAEGGFELKAVFNRDDTQGYLAVRPDQFAVLAFRGTTTLADWVTNLNAGRVPLPERPGITVHKGFLSAFECCRDEIVAAVDLHVPCDLGLYITGHSLGGALAQIASAVLERDNLAACYTFGSPRVGAESFDREVKCPHYRLVNNWDIVPGVPPPWYWGYHHTGDPRLLKPGAKALQALRRDRSVAIRLLVDLLAIPKYFVFRRLGVVDDHMIWNYRSLLTAIATARAKGAPP